MAIQLHRLFFSFLNIHCCCDLFSDLLASTDRPLVWVEIFEGFGQDATHTARHLLLSQWLNENFPRCLFTCVFPIQVCCENRPTLARQRLTPWQWQISLCKGVGGVNAHTEKEQIQHFIRTAETWVQSLQQSLLMMADFVVPPPRHSAVMERLRRRIELFRRHHNSCENRYQNTAKERLELERQQTFALHQRCLQTKAKRSSKHRQPQPNSDQPLQRGHTTGGSNAEQGDGATPGDQNRNSTLIAVSDHNCDLRGGCVKTVLTWKPKTSCTCTFCIHVVLFVVGDF